MKWWQDPQIIETIDTIEAQVAAVRLSKNQAWVTSALTGITGEDADALRQRSNEGDFIRSSEVETCLSN